jgi:Zn-dependent peptidase ImmA (M78 family)
MPKREVPITGTVLAWAREESGMDRETLAYKLRVAPHLIEEWETGATRPSRGQFSEIVDVLKRPSAIFFLPEPPQSAGLPTQFRHAPGLNNHRLSREEITWIRQARRVQAIVSWVLRDQGVKPLDLPRVSSTDATDGVARKWRDRLGVTPDIQRAWKSAYDALKQWRFSLESQGILVMQFSMGKNGIRGFSVWDDYAPLIAANTAYQPVARIFTLFHEMGHLLTRTDSACFQFIAPDEKDLKVERWCERFAADTLLPTDAVYESAVQLGIGWSVREREALKVARRIAGQFKVSVRAVAIRLEELQLVKQDIYYAVEREFGQLDWNSQGEGGGGQSAPEKRLSQLGQRVPAILFSAFKAGRVTESDLSDYLQLTVGQVEDLQSLVGVPRD